MRDDATAYEFLGDWSGQVIATAIHAGHGVRDDLQRRMRLDEPTRLREEDPHTDIIGSRIPARVVVRTSRFEVDLNRPRDGAVYRTPADAWDLEIWQDGALDDEATEASLETYDRFYAELAERLDEVAARGPFMVFDVHSYNHRRDGADQPEAEPEGNPEVNVGTGSLDRDRFGSVVDAFMASLAEQPTSAGALDVRENIRFKGANLARWTHERYPDRAVVLALEFKKTFMDEWTGDRDDARLDELARALEATVPTVERALRELA